MMLKDFINGFKNHPVLFVGTGLSLRYLMNSYSWNDLLEKIAFEFTGSKEYYHDLKFEYKKDNCNDYDYAAIASRLELDFNESVKKDRNGKFKSINDQFYSFMETGRNVSRFKIYLASLLEHLVYKDDVEVELSELRKVRKNIGSVITTNYDNLIEDLFEFKPLVGNNILLSNPYGSVYKIHGCVSEPEKIIVTAQDYMMFENKYELIRAQLLSLFIHHPVIFIGYSISDNNIKAILRTIFTYVERGSELAEKIRSNFLLVEHDENSNNLDVIEHDIDIEGFSTIRINKLKTDNYVELYKELATLNLPVSAMDIRKVQNIVKDIYSGGNIKVEIVSDLESLENSDKVLIIGSKTNIHYDYQNISEIIANYFKIIDEDNHNILTLIDKQNISVAQYFPIFAFSKINNNIIKKETLITQQKDKLKTSLASVPNSCRKIYRSIADIEGSCTSISRKINVILFNALNGNLDLKDLEQYCRKYDDKRSTNYKKVLVAYDFLKYADDKSFE